jgi:hypothetical protein
MEKIEVSKNSSEKYKSMKAFLEVYGWILLSALIVIAILIYFIFSGNLQTTEKGIDLKCAGEKLCTEIGLDYQISSLLPKQIVCYQEVLGITTIEYIFKIINNSVIIEKYPECKID